jgi:hypothetical protein
VLVPLLVFIKMLPLGTMKFRAGVAVVVINFPFVNALSPAPNMLAVETHKTGTFLAKLLNGPNAA